MQNREGNSNVTWCYCSECFAGAQHISTVVLLRIYDVKIRIISAFTGSMNRALCYQAAQLSIACYTSLTFDPYPPPFNPYPLPAGFARV